jgi:NodT family efflux transporter outer membrane factor (OMF) lipoprotein
MRVVHILGIACLAALVGLTGCAIGPDFKRPDAPVARGYSAELATDGSATVVAVGQPVFNQHADIPADWWSLFQSEPLNALIEHALQQNPDIESAHAALRQAQEYANAQRGNYFPTIGLAYTPSRNKVAGNLSSSAPGPQGNGDVIGQPPPQPTYYNFHVTQLNVGYAPDVFGMNRRQVESAQALVAVQQFQLEAAHITLAANVFAAAVQQAVLKAQIAAMEKIVGSNQEQLAIVNSQLNHGAVTGVEVAVQESQLALARQSLIPLRLQLDKNRDLLAALQGNTPDQAAPATMDLATLHLPQELPLSLPSRLVEQRPDVRAAEEKLHYASAQTGVALASRLPQFNVTAAIGGMADTPAWMFKSGGAFFNLSADISQILFDGGALRARSRAAKAALAQAGADYRSTVITALQNVADTLFTLQADAQTVKAAEDAEKAATDALRINQKQYEFGAINYQALLAAQQARELSVIGLGQAEAMRLIDTAALYQALGGGWWNRQDPANGGQSPTFVVTPSPLQQVGQ